MKIEEKNMLKLFQEGTEEAEGEWWKGQIYLAHIVSRYVNITIYLPIQLLYANKNKILKRKKYSYVVL
jgi:hypothetical protein